MKTIILILFLAPVSPLLTTFDIAEEVCRLYQSGEHDQAEALMDWTDNVLLEKESRHVSMLIRAQLRRGA